jgi:hypothetical protein
MLRDKIADIILDREDANGELTESLDESIDKILALIDAQRCVWTLDDGSNTWESSCGVDGMADPKTFDFGEFPFCPCCGKRIEVKEGEDADTLEYR